MENKGVSIRAMVAGTGLSDKTILRARCQRINECRVYTLEGIAKFLGCKVKDLFDEVEAKLPNATQLGRQ